MTGYKQLTKSELEKLETGAKENLALIINKYGYKQAQGKLEYHRAKEHLNRIQRLKRTAPRKSMKA